ncbi:sperm-associated antigen 17-like [Silurus meridionalis]|uniref:sperm-associated antigen 17-like n=1 Tax=Silurus meridionalis TaxID=175797 RepID=UPI001EEAC259|nr:sperm-associated antigen 17-like [Silurus meridionalis]
MRDGSAVVLFADSTVSVSSDAGPVCVSIPRSTGEHKNTSTHTESTDTDVKPSSGVGAEEVEPISKVELKQQVEMTGGSWCTTTPSGVRIRTIRGERVEENPVLTFYSTDPHTHSVMMTRDDGVMCVSGKHKVAVDHADGTRIISSLQQRETQSLQNSGSSDGGRRSRVKVEKSGFATVIMNCEEKSGKVLFRDGTTISATAHGSYRVSLPDGGCLSVCKDGVAVYSSTGPEGEQRGRYIMSHTNGLVCELTDSDGNNYQVTAEGRVSITHTHTDTETQHNTCLSTHPPRLFMVYADGSAVEFLSSQTVDKILQENTHPSVAVIREAIPHTHDAFEITILKPFSDLSSYWLSPTHLDDIIPANLRSRRWDTFPSSEVKTRGTPFGMSLGRDLELKNRTTRGSDPTPPLLQNPKTLVIRRIIEHTPFTQQQQQHLQHNLLLYINKLLQREKLKDEMKLKDPKTVLEKLHITDLHLLQSHSDSSADAPSPLSMHSLYSQAVGVSDSPLSNQHDDQHGIPSKQQRKSEWENRIHQHRLELQEELRHRSALRNRIIMQYFHPEVQDLIRSIQQKPRLTTSSPTLPSLPKRRDAGLQNFSNSM